MALDCVYKLNSLSLSVGQSHVFLAQRLAHRYQVVVFRNGASELQHSKPVSKCVCLPMIGVAIMTVVLLWCQSGHTLKIVSL